ncbi:MAG: lamin tail domain-containing protein, partial [Bacteroidota bacterium]
MFANRYRALKNWLALFAICLLPTQSFGQVVISQVYPGGGGTTGTYQKDYVEIYNRGCSSVNIGGWAIEYGSATGTWGPTSASIFSFPTNTIIPSGKYILVALGAVGTGGAVLPVTADFSTTNINMGATAGKVALFNATNSNLACGSEIAGTLVDKVAWGTSNCAEGTAITGSFSTNVMVRKNDGQTDSNNNSGDFTVTATSAAPPRNSSSPANPLLPCGTPLSASSTAGTIACFGGTTSVTVSATGGTAPYTGTGTFTVTAGTYSYTVTDNAGATATTSITVT